MARYLALRSSVHSLHLTVIFLKVPRDELPPAPRVYAMGGFDFRVTGEETFGPPDKPVRAATVGYHQKLMDLRAWAERTLISTGAEWDQRWEFNPHVTIPKDMSLPTYLRFDRVEWVE